MEMLVRGARILASRTLNEGAGPHRREFKRKMQQFI